MAEMRSNGGGKAATKDESPLHSGARSSQNSEFFWWDTLLRVLGVSAVNALLTG